MTMRGMAGSPQTASATARARAGPGTVIPAGKAKCTWFCGRALTRLTTSRVTAAGSEHSAALLELPGSAVPVLAGLAVPVLPGLAVLVGWVALDVVAARLPQAPISIAAPAAARTSSPGRVRRPDWVPGTPMVSSVPWAAKRAEKSLCPGH
jgi:hypothetical protein